MGKKLNKLTFAPLIQAQKKFDRRATIVLGETAKQFFRKNFKLEGFLDKTLSPWAKRKKETSKTLGNRVLQGVSNDLNLSIDRFETNKRRVRIGSRGVIYADRHNRGLDGMRKRKFIGNSSVLEKILLKLIEKELKRANR